MTQRLSKHIAEEDLNIAEQREKAGLQYVASYILKSDKPRDRCFYDGTTLQTIAQNEEVIYKRCRECLIGYEISIPKKEENL